MILCSVQTESTDPTRNPTIDPWINDDMILLVNILNPMDINPMNTVTPI